MWRFQERCDYSTLYIEGTDNVIPRPVFDFTEDYNGDLYFDFPTFCRM